MGKALKKFDFTDPFGMKRSINLANNTPISTLQAEATKMKGCSSCGGKRKK